jgi:hypothetical protein
MPESLFVDRAQGWPDLLESVTTGSLFQSLHRAAPLVESGSLGRLPSIDMELLKAAKEGQLQVAGTSEAVSALAFLEIHPACDQSRMLSQHRWSSDPADGVSSDSLISNSLFSNSTRPRRGSSSAS